MNKKPDVKPTPKRFNLGVWCRETQELFIQGWMVADEWMKEDRRRTQAKIDRKITVGLLENRLYDDGARGTLDDRLEILKYLQQKENAEIQAKEAEQHRPVLIGDQLFSLVTTVLSLSIVGGALGLSIGMFMNFTCDDSNSQVCRDVQYVTKNFTDYFANKDDFKH